MERDYAVWEGEARRRRLATGLEEGRSGRENSSPPGKSSSYSPGSGGKSNESKKEESSYSPQSSDEAA
ncbi:hypothetical protein B0A55_12233, partial [Friedmanniomyces simplex]